MDSEDAETYLRLLAETELRRARRGRSGPVAPGAAPPGELVRDVAAAFAWTGALDAELALTIADDFGTALDTRLTTGDDSPRPPLRGPSSFSPRLSPRRRVWAATSAMAGASHDIGPVTVTPAGHVLRSDGHPDVFVLAVAMTTTRTWLTAAVHTGRHQPPQLAAPRIPRPPRGASQPGFPPALTAADSAGARYRVGLGGGGGSGWFHGQAELRPNPAAATTWLDVSSGGPSVRIDLTAPPPQAQITVTPVALSPGEAFLQAQADSLIATGHRPAITDGLARLAAVVPALTAVGALPVPSLTGGRLRWLCERFGVTGHGLTIPPAEPPERWADLLACQETGREERPDAYFSGNGDRAHEAGQVAMADLVVTLPEVDGLVISLAGLISHSDGTAVHGMYHGAGTQTRDYDELPPCWLRDDSGQWHFVSRWGWTSDSSGVTTFYAAVRPPVAPGASSVEVLVCGRTAEVRARVPLTWRTS